MSKEPPLSPPDDEGPWEDEDGNLVDEDGNPITIQEREPDLDDQPSREECDEAADRYFSNYVYGNRYQ